MPRKSTVKATQDAAFMRQEEFSEQVLRTDSEDVGTPDDEMCPHTETETVGELSGSDILSVPQTDPEENFREDNPSLQAGGDENPPVSHTDFEESESERTEYTPFPQTDIETGGNPLLESPALSAALGDVTEHHTDLEQATEAAAGTQTSGLSSDQPPVPQTGSEKLSQSSFDEAKPRRRAAKSRSGESPVLPDADPQSGSRSGDPSSPPARRRRRETPIVSIDDRRTVETDADKLKSDLIDMIESQKGRKLISGTIQGMERPPGSPNISFAVTYHGAFKVIIPAEECVKPPEDFRDRSPADVMHYLVTKRLGAEIDYIVKGVDAQTGVAAASRLEAMALKRRDYYFGSDRDGNNLLYEGISAEARVVSVIRAGMFVDLFGLETYIPLRELSYQRWIDATAHYRPGQRVLVKILTLDRSDRNNIRVTASVKQAGENPYEAALKKYTPGSRYVGTVSLVDTNGVFVSLDGGIDCLCSYPKRGRPPRGSRVTVRIIGVNHETNRIWGAITHMTTVR
ncbi:MAG: S1 RNA-binding domain-containing protein [Gracilibacteraceae bacterium]|nr:S1 RNA-binding domain-containing protein [Gracilibacteraceae bacterium]